jgi:uncharacterized protein (TIGR02444 family)
MSAEQGFWAFSLKIYAAAGVADECLRLQNRHGVDVNLLLLCAYLGAVPGVVLTDRDIADARDTVAAWHTGVVKELRAVRQTLKPMLMQKDAALSGEIAALRTRVKEMELESERLEHLLLEKWANERSATFRHEAPMAAAEHNISTLLRFYGAAGDGAMPERPVALLKTLAT